MKNKKILKIMKNKKFSKCCGENKKKNFKVLKNEVFGRNKLKVLKILKLLKIGKLWKISMKKIMKKIKIKSKMFEEIFKVFEVLGRIK